MVYLCLILILYNLKVTDFIQSALYDPNHDYFSQRSGSVGSLEKGIKFNQLQGITSENRKEKCSLLLFASQFSEDACYNLSF
ncbi:hypothetical protein AQUCO_11100005v1 [Aquilegia coerulea]|uniref:Uncharacterized protein n=1 Tax=Aquilegia coerulea TaxID=218851 RepID=A0A2G5C2M4_AQUCA|nr:hypothetical protein AQUCO_11100005v1 [Aquilegia coerulea]